MGSPMTDIKQRLADMRAEMQKLKDEGVSWEERMKQDAKDREERGNRQRALTWLRTLLFPFIEEQASIYGMTVREAADKIVRDGTRIDLLLRQNWDSSEIRRLLDSGLARSVVIGSASLLNESDEKTMEGSIWLLEKVLPEDLEGRDIRDAFAASAEGVKLWTDTMLGLKRLFANRMVRPAPARSPVRRF